MVFGIGTIIGNFAGARAADGNLLRAIPLILIWCALIQAGFYFAADWTVAGIIFVGLVGTSMALGPALQTRLMDVAEDAQTMAASMNHAAFNLANALGAWLAGITVKQGLGLVQHRPGGRGTGYRRVTDLSIRADAGEAQQNTRRHLPEKNQ